MNAEITDKGAGSLRGWVFYDGTCALCCREVNRWEAVLARRGFHFAPLQLAWVKARLGFSDDILPGEMQLLLADGRVLGGAQALAKLARQIWWLWPVGILAGLPLLRSGCAVAYRWLARNRYCLGGQCKFAKISPADSSHHRCAAFFEMP